MDNIIAQVGDLQRFIETNQITDRLQTYNFQNIKWASFPYLFGSSSGPHGGIGLCVMTEFQIYIFQDRQSGKIIKYCDGTWKESTSFTYDWT